MPGGIATRLPAQAQTTQSVQVELTEAQAGVATGVQLEVAGQYESLTLENGRIVLRARPGQLEVTTSSFAARVAPGREGEVRGTQAFFSVDDSGRCRAISVVLSFVPAAGRQPRQVTLTVDLLIETAYTTPRAASVVVRGSVPQPSSTGLDVQLRIEVATADSPFRSISWVALRQRAFDASGSEIRIPREQQVVAETVLRPMGPDERQEFSLTVSLPGNLPRGPIMWAGVLIGETDKGQVVAEPVRATIQP
jgi:hypothetical protein